MRRGICKLSIIPMRKEMSHESELVSELLYNDIYEILEDNNEWLRIRCECDSYEGWIRSIQHSELTESEYSEIISKDRFITKEAFTSYNGNILSFGSEIFESNSACHKVRNELDTNIMVESAIKLLNTPYRWGGKSIMGIDCSAYVQLCVKIAGFKLPRDASQQVEFGIIINSLSESRAGDIAFFDNEKGKITHVGILLSNDKIIHASGKVRIDNIDNRGIFNKDINMYTHKLRIIKRLEEKQSIEII